MNILPTKAQIAHFLTVDNDITAEETIRPRKLNRYNTGSSLANVLRASTDERASTSDNDLLKEGYE